MNKVVNLYAILLINLLLACSYGLFNKNKMVCDMIIYVSMLFSLTVLVYYAYHFVTVEPFMMRDNVRLTPENFKKERMSIQDNTVTEGFATNLPLWLH